MNPFSAYIQTQPQPSKIEKAVETVKKDVEDFALQSDAMDVALGVLIGAAVTPLTTSLVHDMIIPPFALLFGGRELSNMHWVLKDGPSPGSYTTIEEARKDGAVIIRYGNFIQSVVNCGIIFGITYGLLKFLKDVRKKGGFKQYWDKIREAKAEAEAEAT